MLPNSFLAIMIFIFQIFLGKYARVYEEEVAAAPKNRREKEENSHLCMRSKLKLISEHPQNIIIPVHINKNKSKAKWPIPSPMARIQASMVSLASC